MEKNLTDSVPKKTAMRKPFRKEVTVLNIAHQHHLSNKN